MQLYAAPVHADTTPTRSLRFPDWVHVSFHRDAQESLSQRVKLQQGSVSQLLLRGQVTWGQINSLWKNSLHLRHLVKWIYLRISVKSCNRLNAEWAFQTVNLQTLLRAVQWHTQTWQHVAQDRHHYKALSPSTTPGKSASSGQEDLGSSNLSIMSWTEVTELISPASNCWHFPVTTENQSFACERVISLWIPNSVWPHPVWDERCTLPFPQVAFQKQLAWNDSTVILIYNYRGLYALQTTFAACTVPFVEKHHSHLTIPPRESCQKWRDSKDRKHCMDFFVSPAPAKPQYLRCPWVPQQAQVEILSRVAVIYRGYNSRQYVLRL